MDTAFTLQHSYEINGYDETNGIFDDDAACDHADNILDAAACAKAKAN